jgi:hypothetical protein
LIDALVQLFVALGNVVWELVLLLAPLALLITWIAWWLWAVNWRKAWLVLREGAWVPVVLLIVLSARVWASLAPSDCSCLGFVTIGNFWWQLGGVGAIAALTLFCGWLQVTLGWSPEEISLEPTPAVDHGHHHHH